MHRFLYFSLLLVLCWRDPLPAQQRYHTYDELTSAITGLMDRHMDIASVASLGKTREKRDLWMVTIGGKNAGTRHALLLVGGIEGNRVIGSELALSFLAHLLENYGKVDSITQLVNTTTLYIVPRANPDASEAFFRRPLYERSFNARPTDDDRDGSIDEDGFEDLNGDGIITMMRVSDERGEWMPHPDDSRILKKADPAKGEKGVFKLYAEGTDNDKDEQWNEDEPGGVDLNRNFPHNYTFFARGAGPHQISEEESRVLADFAFDHPNIAAVFTFSGNDNLLTPWKAEKGKPDESQRFVLSVMEEDEPYLSFIGKQYQEITKFTGAPSAAKGEGSVNEWAYYHFGRWSFSANPWWIPGVEAKPDSAAPGDTTKKNGDAQADTARKKPEQKKGKGNDEKPADEYADQVKALKWMDAHGVRDGFIPWTEVRHADFPGKKVEVGGFKPYVLTNPPADSIDAIAGKTTAFLLSLAGRLPSLAISNVRVESSGDKVFRVTAGIVNTGYLPTNSAMGRKARWPRDVKVTLTLGNNQQIASGKAVTLLDPIKGSNGSTELTWLVVGRSGSTVTLTAESPLAGSASQTVTLR